MSPAPEDPLPPSSAEQRAVAAMNTPTTSTLDARGPQLTFEVLTTLFESKMAELLAAGKHWQEARLAEAISQAIFSDTPIYVVDDGLLPRGAPMCFRAFDHLLVRRAAWPAEWDCYLTPKPSEKP